MFHRKKYSISKSFFLYKSLSFHDTYETRRVIVTDGLGVTESFKNRVSLYDLIFKGALVLLGFILLGGGTNGGEVSNYLLGVFSLTSTRLTGNQHRLIDVVGQHVDVGTIRNGENVGWHFITALTTVHLSATVGIYGVTLVGIDGNAEKTRVGLYICHGEKNNKYFINKILRKIRSGDFLKGNITEEKILNKKWRCKKF